MVERLLLLMLVLGMASSANAIVIRVDGQDHGQAVDIAEGFTSVISVVSEDTSSWLGYIIVEEGGTGVLGEAARLGAAGGAICRIQPPGIGSLSRNRAVSLRRAETWSSRHLG